MFIVNKYKKKEKTFGLTMAMLYKILFEINTNLKTQK